MYFSAFTLKVFLCLHERYFCDINHAQWRWGRGADLSTTRQPHINIRWNTIHGIRCMVHANAYCVPSQPHINIRRIRGNLHTELPTPETRINQTRTDLSSSEVLKKKQDILFLGTFL